MKDSQTNIDQARWKTATRMVYKNYWHETKLNKHFSFPGMIIPAINNILIAYVPPLAIAGIISKANSNQGVGTVGDFLPYILLFSGAWLIGEVLMRIGIHLMIKNEYLSMKALYDKGLSELLRRDLGFFNDNFAGSLTKKTLGYANRYIDIYDTMSFSVIAKIIPIFFASVVLWIYSPWLVLCLLSWLTLAIVVATPLIKRRRKLVTEREIAHNVVSGHIADVYSNISAVRAFATEDSEVRRNRTLVLDMADKVKKSWDYQNNRIDMVIAPIYVITNTSGLILALYLAQTNVISYTSIIVVFAYYALVTNFMWEFNSIYKRLESAFADAAQYTELLLTEPTIHDSKQPKQIAEPKGAIKFDGVDFSYEEGSKSLFKDFSLDIKAGEKIGLVGRSGGGKTSITKLLLRFSDINEGSISIDGVDIRDLKQQELRSLVAYVPQDPAMFHRSINKNIAYGKPEASEAEIIDTSKKAHAHEFIKDLAQGYETLVGERGIKLSGGQRQRVAIARAMLKDSPILLLDEATSALDSESELLIQDALFKLMEGKTAIVIAHRLSTIQKMDRIIVLDKGHIIEQGSHAELVKHGGVYADLWSHQSGGFIED